MYRHILLTSALALSLSACAKKSVDNETPVLTTSDVEIEYNDISTDLSDAALAPDDQIYSNQLGDIEPGTQEDLVSTTGDRVFYDYNSDELEANAKRTVEGQVAWLMQYPNTNVLIEGHADERGTREYNLALAERRAIAVKNYMLRLGVNANRVNVISYGKEHPEFLDSNDIAWAKNRRAVTVVIR